MYCEHSYDKKIMRLTVDFKIIEVYGDVWKASIDTGYCEREIIRLCKYRKLDDEGYRWMLIS